MSSALGNEASMLTDKSNYSYFFFLYSVQLLQDSACSWSSAWFYASDLGKGDAVDYGYLVIITIALTFHDLASLAILGTYEFDSTAKAEKRLADSDASFSLVIFTRGMNLNRGVASSFSRLYASPVSVAE